MGYPLLMGSIDISWRPWGPAWLIILTLAGVGLLVTYLYRIDARRLSRNQWIFLLCWRIAMVMLILLLLMEPSYRLVTTEKRPPVVAVVIDESRSMSLPAASDNPFIALAGGDKRVSRYTVAIHAAAKVIPQLNKTHRIKILAASDRVETIADIPYRSGISEKELLNLLKKKHPKPTGNFSLLGDALEEVVKRLSASSKLSAVFFFTDGRVTGGTSIAETAPVAVSAGVPVYTIGLGSTEPLPDLKLTDLTAPPDANINDVMEIQVTVSNAIKPSLRVPLELYEEGKKEPVATRKLVLPLGEKRISISTIPTREGEIKYTLKLPVPPEDLEPSNNSISFHVNVSKKKLRVLFVAGRPTMEYLHIVPALVRDRMMSVSCFLQSADVNAVQQGNEIIQELPRTPSEWDTYDVVILYDIDPNRFTNEQENSLEQLIQNGGGLLFIAGRTFGMSRLLQVRGAKMRAMLPVEINKNIPPDYDMLYDKPFHIARTREGEKHPMLIFAPTKEKNDEIWRSFSNLDFFWHQPVIKVKRQAVPLLAVKRSRGGYDRRKCIMALMRYGKGSVAYLGIHTMWRWRFPMENYDYDRFWNQVVRYLAEYRMLGSQRQVLLATDKKIYSPGETVKITLSILDPALATQLRTEHISVAVRDEHGGEYRVMLRQQGNDYSTRTGTFLARRLGEHEVHARHVLSTDLAAKKALFDEKTHFTVRMQTPEFKDTTADLASLKETAETTGGMWANHTNISDRLPKFPSSVDTTPQYIPHEKFDDLWDTWYVLLLLIVMTTVELWFRRYWGLL